MAVFIFTAAFYIEIFVGNSADHDLVPHLHNIRNGYLVLKRLNLKHAHKTMLQS